MNPLVNIGIFLVIAGVIALPVFVMVSVALAFAFGEWLRDCVHH